jgi:hypothetical protein
VGILPEFDFWPGTCLGSVAPAVPDPLAQPKPHSVLIGTRVARGAALRYVVSDKRIWGATARILRRERVLGDLFERLGRPVR